jgi:hypothetical protein
MEENTLTIKYSEDVLLSLKESKEEFEEEARYLLALKLYEPGKISSGKMLNSQEYHGLSFLRLAEGTV